MSEKEFCDFYDGNCSVLRAADKSGIPIDQIDRLQSELVLKEAVILQASEDIAGYREELAITKEVIEAQSIALRMHSKELADLKEWRKVEDGKEPDGNVLLIVEGKVHGSFGCYYLGAWWSNGDLDLYKLEGSMKPTKWLPIPEAGE